MPTPDELRERLRVRNEVIACRACPLGDQSNGPVPFAGPSPCEAVIIGEAPGAEEDQAGRPFVGSAGRLLRGYLRHHGVEDRVAFVNAVSCYPSRTPTGREVSLCAGNLASQINLLSPKYVLYVGGVALSSAWPGERITDVRGHWWVADEVSYLATWHPAAVLRNQDLSDEFRVDIGDWVEVVNGEKPWRKHWCTKCNREAKHWIAPTGASLGVPYCQECHTSKVGVRKLPKVPRRKTTSKLL